MRKVIVVLSLLASARAFAAPAKGCHIGLAVGAKAAKAGSVFDVGCLPALSARGTLVAVAVADPDGDRGRPNLRVKFYPLDGRPPASTVVLDVAELDATAGQLDAALIAKIEPRLDLVNAQLSLAGFVPFSAAENDGLELTVKGDTVELRGRRKPQASQAVAASVLNTRAMRKFRSKDWAGAAADFRAAIARFSDHVKARYNLACLASITRDRDTALEQLRWLAASGLPEAGQKIAKARTDPDLRFIRDDPEAKEILARAR